MYHVQQGADGSHSEPKGILRAVKSLSGLDFRGWGGANVIIQCLEIGG